MKSISFFPFTRINEDQLRIMDLFFDGFKMLALAKDTLSDPWVSSAVEKGRIEPFSLGGDAQVELEAKLRAFREWAAVHRGNERNLKALIRENTYFQDETDVTAIQAGIRQGMAPLSGTPTEAITDPLLFLRFAEILDRENEEIQSKLSAMEQNTSSLFAELKGEIQAPEPAEVGGRNLDPGADRTGERIFAWCTAARVSGLFDPEEKFPVLVTTSPAVFAYLSAKADPPINGLDIDSIKVHEHDCNRSELRQPNFYQIIDEFISGSGLSWTVCPEDAGCSCQTGEVRLIRFPGNVLNKTFDIPGTQVVVCLVKLNS